MFSSPKDRYENDLSYKTLVDTMTALIHKCKLTPSEMREAAVLASIHYELHYGFRQYTVPMQVNEAFKTLTNWRKEEEDGRANKDKQG